MCLKIMSVAHLKGQNLLVKMSNFSSIYVLSKAFTLMLYIMWTFVFDRYLKHVIVIIIS